MGMFNKVWCVVRPRIFGILAVSVVFVIPLSLLTWFFDIFGELRLRILISVLSGIMLVAAATADPGFWRSRQELLWSAVFFVSVLLFATGDRFDMPALATNSAILIATLPCCALVWLLTGRSWLLCSALASAAVLMLIYWRAVLGGGTEPWDILLLPISTVTIAGILWAPVAFVAMRFARRLKYRPLAGPGLQVLAMVIVFFPTMLVAVVVPWMFKIDTIWSAVSLTLVGVLLSAVISEPLKRLLLRWGKLSPESD